MSKNYSIEEQKEIIANEEYEKIKDIANPIYELQIKAVAHNFYLYCHIENPHSDTFNVATKSSYLVLLKNDIVEKLYQKEDTFLENWITLSQLSPKNQEKFIKTTFSDDESIIKALDTYKKTKESLEEFVSFLLEKNEKLEKNENSKNESNNEKNENFEFDDKPE